MRNTGLFSVSKFAELSQMPESTIRHYDRIGLLSPALRGENNYRYYSRKQVADINVIRTLQELGLALSEIKAVMARRNPRSVIDMLGEQSKIISGNMTRWAGARSLAQTLLWCIEPVLDVDEDAVTVKTLPERTVLFGEANDYSNGRDAYDALFSFYEAMNAAYPGLCFNYPVWGMFSEERIRRRDWHMPDRYYLPAPIGRDTLPEALYAVGYKRCGYGQGRDLYEKMTDYIETNGLEICGNAYEEYPLNEFCSSDETQYLMRVMIVVREKA